MLSDRLGKADPSNAITIAPQSGMYHVRSAEREVASQTNKPHIPKDKITKSIKSMIPTNNRISRTELKVFLTSI
jgi:hypothetical protein